VPISHWLLVHAVETATYLSPAEYSGALLLVHYMLCIPACHHSLSQQRQRKITDREQGENAGEKSGVGIQVLPCTAIDLAAIPPYTPGLLRRTLPYDGATPLRHSRLSGV